MKPRLYRAIGLMSGTSADGIDAAVVETDGEQVLKLGPSLSEPYEKALSNELLNGLQSAREFDISTSRQVEPFQALERALTEAHARAVRHLMKEAGLEPENIDVVGFHGQTILHRPEERFTWQLGDGAALARELGIAVVNDFRSQDVALGGQGAPFAPLYHAALGAKFTDRPYGVINLGGVGNVTWIGEGEDNILAFDTGPANAPVNDWLRLHTGQPMDEHGKQASLGRVDEARLQEKLSHPYFSRPAPKSLDRFDFGMQLADGLSLADGAATLTAFSAAAVEAGLKHMPDVPRLWVVCGGGRHNEVLMRELKARLPGKVLKAEDVGWRGDVLEAEAFAYLAVRSLRGLALSLPRTTGAPHAVCGGQLHQPG